MFILIGLAAPLSMLAAQDPGVARWELQGGRDSYCVWYLAAPALARDLVPSATVLTPAGTGIGLPSLLMRTVQDEPRFAQWIPGAICIASYDSVTADGRAIAQARGGRPLRVAISWLAATDARGIEGTKAYLLDLMTDQKELSKAADALGLSMSVLKVSSRQRIEGDDPEVTIDIGGVKIVWSGHPSGEPRVGTTRTLSFGYAGSRSSNWQATLERAPATSRLLVGVLQVIGRNTLAKAMKASPVRAIGPEEVGGTTVLTLRKLARR